MPAITIINLTWSTPDNHRILSDLSLNFGAERIGLIGRNGVGKSTLLRLISRELPLQSGTIAVNGNLGILRQAVRPASSETIADLFSVTDGLALMRRADAGTADIGELGDADWTIEDRIRTALGRVGLDAQPDTPLILLSGGQRTRASLAGLIFASPDILLLDEPTNNRERARKAICRAS